MSEADRVEQMRRDAGAADELMFNVTDRSIGSSSCSDPDSAVRITKPDADLFGNWR
jgi:hypothetical protein